MYKKVLIKLSGEVMCGEGSRGFYQKDIEYLVKQISQVVDYGTNVGIVIGAGNIFRGEELSEVPHSLADQIGMLGTVINALYLKGALEKHNVKCVVVSQISSLPSIRPIHYDDINLYFDAGYVVVFAGGTSNPFFTTDTAAALRAVEMGASVLIKATKVDGVYDSDPKKNKAARKFEKISYQQAIKLGLKVMDMEAFSICGRYKLPIIVLNFFEDGALLKAVRGEDIGSIILPD
ncbi:MAG TPA: UMP kinase [Pseudothermotoga sp.]|nr:UMP kinase [Pseudothermotoga sp.]HOK84600.1 UMP kinase [Pseudothermotoga sp.]HPP69225.1 UMP kinase [Pseudothermotoga sp.]